MTPRQASYESSPHGEIEESPALTRSPDGGSFDLFAP
jgi:hypothetical protein